MGLSLSGISPVLLQLPCLQQNYTTCKIGVMLKRLVPHKCNNPIDEVAARLEKNV